jgi:hypothetical protein
VNVVLEVLRNFRAAKNRLPLAGEYKEIFQSWLPEEYLEGDKLRSKIMKLKKKYDILHRRRKKLKGTCRRISPAGWRSASA